MTTRKSKTWTIKIYFSELKPLSSFKVGDTIECDNGKSEGVIFSDRGDGFYSIDWIKNHLGMKVSFHSADKLVSRVEVHENIITVRSFINNYTDSFSTVKEIKITKKDI